MAGLPASKARVGVRPPLLASGANNGLVLVRLLGLQRMYPRNRLYQVFAERVANFRTTPPPVDWDGVFDWKTK